ncbi:VOC family protein [Thermobifida halotolerans]|uniref:VOC family protein n=1 Tax=Thermobifida halotolerans TaxID=483545 RepID=A0A399G1Y9_9ACTN|nr:VOC family protein [Thermobifida halotolerans]UOE20928.1 VOC family protein [Thermobifida halotolerans]
MGIQRVESITYSVEDVSESVRFFEDLGLTLVESDHTGAVFETLVKQTVHLRTEPDSALPPPVEPAPTVREVVWGVDTPDELERLVGRLAVDRPVRRTDDGTYHTYDETGFGLGLTLARPDGFEPDEPRPRNTMGHITRRNTVLETVGQVRPLRICHVALNIPKQGHQEAIDFYLDRLGFVATDVVKPMGTFMRCEDDEEQHNFLLCHRPDRAGMNHIALEVPGFDDVIEGANHMIERGWLESRRLGRHTIGSNVFRFVHAPCGGRVEYAADMDRVDSSYGTRVHETAPPHHIWTLRTSRENR